jgi:hypothetical protein
MFCQPIVDRGKVTACDFCYLSSRLFFNNVFLIKPVLVFIDLATSNTSASLSSLIAGRARPNRGHSTGSGHNLFIVHARASQGDSGREDGFYRFSALGGIVILVS